MINKILITVIITQLLRGHSKQAKGLSIHGTSTPEK